MVLPAFLFLAIAMQAPPPERSQSGPPNPPAEVQPAAAQEIAGLLAKQYAAWNAGDIDGYMQVFWHSPLLVYIIEGSLWRGWDEVNMNVRRDYPIRENMGQAVLDRLETNVIAPDLAVTVELWSVYFPKGRKLTGMCSSTWRKFQEGWRVVHLNTSTLEQP